MIIRERKITILFMITLDGKMAVLRVHDNPRAQDGSTLHDKPRAQDGRST